MRHSLPNLLRTPLHVKDRPNVANQQLQSSFSQCGPKGGAKGPILENPWSYEYHGSHTLQQRRYVRTPKQYIMYNEYHYLLPR